MASVHRTVNVYTSLNILQELESQLNDVQEKLASRDAQVETLTATLKKSSEGGRKAQEEITKLQFQLATLTNSYDQLQRKLVSCKLF
jgi:peptidoglycan hydrolase CwlO-like protein